MIRRIQTNRGIRYQDERGRFVSSRTGAREFVRQNLTNINTGQPGLRYEDLTTRERQSYSAQNRYRFQGQFVTNPFNYLRQFESVTRGQRELSNFFTRENFRELQQQFTLPYSADRSESGRPERLRGELQDILGEILRLQRGGYTLNVTGRNGQEYQDLAAMEQLRQFEDQTLSVALRNAGQRRLDRYRINYEVSVNPQTQEIEIDLNDIDEDRDIEFYYDTP